MTSLAVVVLGEPASQGSIRARPIFRGRGADKVFTGKVAMTKDSKKTKPWRARVTTAAKDALAEQKVSKFLGPVRVRVMFVFPRPGYHYRTGRFVQELRPNPPHWHTVKVDVDKAVRAILDSLADAGVFRNDSQVCDLRAIKVYSDPDSPWPAYCSIEITEASPL